MARSKLLGRYTGTGSHWYVSRSMHSPSAFTPFGDPDSSLFFLSFFFPILVLAPACEHQLLAAKLHAIFCRMGRFHAVEENLQRVGWSGASCGVDKLHWRQCYPDGIGMMMPFSLSVDAGGCP